MSLLKTFSADQLRVKILSSREDMGREAARDIAACMRQLLKEKDEIRMIFAAAPSQNETLRFLLREDGIDWARANAFHMDEYVGLPAGDSHTFGSYLEEHIFSKAPFHTVHYLRGDAADPEAECRRYGALLQAQPVDIVVLGIGENGHIAFNDPWVADFQDPKAVKLVALDPVCRQQQVNDGCFPSLQQVPTHALTLTIPTLASAGHLFCSVPAATKQWAVTATVQGEISQQVPATIMRRHPDAILYCDPDSAGGIL